jgi:NAD(P)H-hydrate epimerase
VPILKPRLPRRPDDLHKGQAGHVLVIGGSVGMSGAPRLAGRAALRVGAGLVSLAVPEPIRAEIAADDPALMVAGLRATAAGTVAWPAAKDLLARAMGMDAVVLGPGMGRHSDTLALARRLAVEVQAPVVIDADALFALGGEAVDFASPSRILTPHPGEAARLLGSDTAEVQRDREGAARALVARFGCIVVLKGAATLVAHEARLFVNTTGNPGLAHGGTGDVLAGMIGGLLAQGLAPLEAACAGVFLHGRAADLLLPETGQRGLTPNALIEALPRTVKLHEPHRPQR